MRVQNRFKDFSFTKSVLILLFGLFGFQIVSYLQNNKTDGKKDNETQEDIVRIDTNLVAIPTAVLDREGRYVSNLKKEDFQIFEDGVEQEIALFKTSETPVTIFLMLDLSGSMAYHINQLTDASNVFVDTLRSEDRLLVATFDEQVHLLFNAKSIKDVRKNNSIRLRINGLPYETMVYDAVEFAIKKMKKIRGRKAIILFSDGIGRGYTATAKSNLRDAEENEAPIYTVGFDTSPNTPFRHESEKAFQKRLEDAKLAKSYIRDLAQICGGRHYQLEKIVDLEKTFGSIADELKQQYNLGYYPKQSEKREKKQVRQIKVKVTQPNLAVRARSSYVIEKK